MILSLIYFVLLSSLGDNLALTAWPPRSGQMQGAASTGRGGFETRPYEDVSTGSAAATPQMAAYRRIRPSRP
jgi:hypothetical protein